MTALRFALLGTGFWAQHQLAAWQELDGARCVALYNRTRAKAEALAARFGVPAVYDAAEQLLRQESLDFVDIVTDVGTHARFVQLAAQHDLPVICQKPMAPTLEQAEAMVAACRQAGVDLLVHENWRWQHPLRQLKSALQGPRLGACFRARVTFSCSFPVFANQPFLAELDQFILTDIGSHILDTARFLFGEPNTLFARTSRVNPGIRGEDVATVVLGMADGATVTCEMSYASRLEHERFPQTYVLAECERGSVELGVDYWLRLTTADGTLSRRVVPPHPLWADPAYDLPHASIAPCHADLLAHLRGQKTAETTGEDNLRTVRLVFGAYQSAAEGKVVQLS